MSTTTTITRTPPVTGRVGESILRLDGPTKVKGEFAYASDLQVAGMLWGHTLRSPHAHARIVSIDTTEALTMAGVHAVLTHEDVPGQKTYGLEFADQPVLASDRVRYYGEAVALVAAEHPEQARRAAEARDFRGRLTSDLRKLGGDFPRHQDHLAGDALRRLGVRREVPGRRRSRVAVAAAP